MVFLNFFLFFVLLFQPLMVGYLFRNNFIVCNFGVIAKRKIIQFFNRCKFIKNMGLHFCHFSQDWLTCCIIKIGKLWYCMVNVVEDVSAYLIQWDMASMINCELQNDAFRIQMRRPKNVSEKSHSHGNLNKYSAQQKDISLIASS